MDASGDRSQGQPSANRHKALRRFLGSCLCVVCVVPLRVLLAPLKGSARVLQSRGLRLQYHHARRAFHRKAGMCVQRECVITRPDRKHLELHLEHTASIGRALRIKPCPTRFQACYLSLHMPFATKPSKTLHKTCHALQHRRAQACRMAASSICGEWYGSHSAGYLYKMVGWFTNHACRVYLCMDAHASKVVPDALGKAEMPCLCATASPSSCATSPAAGATTVAPATISRGFYLPECRTLREVQPSYRESRPRCPQ